MLTHLKFRQKLILLPAVAGCVFILILIATQFFGSKNKKLLSEIETGYVSAMELSRDMEQVLMAIQYSLQYAVAASDKEELSRADSLKNQFFALLEIGRSNPVLNHSDMDLLEHSFTAYYTLARQSSLSMINGNYGEATVHDLEIMNRRYNSIKSTLAFNTQRDKEKMVSAFTTTRINNQKSTLVIRIIIISTILLISLLSFILTHTITSSLKKVVTAAEELAIGNVDVKLDIQSKDEIGHLAASFRLLIENIKDLTNAARAIGAGDYSVAVRVRHEKDILGNALATMKQSLISMTEETRQQNWYKTGLSELNDRMRGEQDVTTLAQNVINYIAEFMNVQIGALYLAQEDKTLQLVASYAYKKRKNISNNFKFGEGLVGQAALEKKSILVTSVPDDYIHIESGLGEKSPDSIFVFPFLYENEVAGVIELGSFGMPKDIQLRYLEQVTENIAINFVSAKSRLQLRELLSATRKQAEELRTRQEELEAANSQLETQTKALRESEARLQNQQEELQQTNEELEEQTEALERQKEILRQKNEELRVARDEVQKKAHDLELANQYKTEFLANISHELRTPLNSLLILSKLLADNKENNLTPDQIKFAHTIYTAGSDLLAVINDILDLSKVEAGKLEVYPDSTRIDDIVNTLRLQFAPLAEQKKLSFTFEISPNLPSQIVTDQKRVEQVLKNLLSNAFKFTSAGAVSVKIYEPNGEIQFKNPSLAQKSAIAFKVSDTGIGIPPDKKEAIFENFQQAEGTTNRRFGGTGLGLSISREFSRLLGGEIHLESAEGKGSTFTLILPQDLTNGSLHFKTKPEPASNPQPLLETSAHQAKEQVFNYSDDRDNIKATDRSILIIEDDMIFSQVLQNLAKDKGFKCLVAHDGETGLQLAQKYYPSGIIADLGLPGMNGWTIMEKLKSNPQTRHIPVHVVSGSEDGQDAIRLGAFGVLYKPVDPVELRDALEKIKKFSERGIRKLLVVEDDDIERDSIVQLIGNGDVETTAVADGREAIKLLQSKSFDCMVLDLGLKDISGFELLEKIRHNDSIDHLPIIIHTGKDLTQEEKTKLQKLAESVIIKGEKSPERLLDETTLFLHRVEKNLPKTQQRIIRMIHNKEVILQDKKVLLVDDDMRNVFALSHVLEERGIKVVIGKNGKEGIKMLHKHEDIDLVLMDIMMPKMDGYEAIRQIRKKKKYRKLPIIALTAKAMKGDKEKCIQAGASDYLSKPVDIERLVSLMRVWLCR